MEVISEINILPLPTRKQFGRAGEAMTTEDRVKNKHADARSIAYDDGNGGVGGYEIWCESDSKRLGEGRFETEAWADAFEGDL